MLGNKLPPEEQQATLTSESFLQLHPGKTYATATFLLVKRNVFGDRERCMQDLKFQWEGNRIEHHIKNFIMQAKLYDRIALFETLYLLSLKGNI